MESFNIKAYHSLLEKFSERKLIQSFWQIEEMKPELDPHLILRHDIDADLILALPLARWERKKKYGASYFVQLHSPYYSVWDGEGIKAIKEIMSLGHEIGLHFDPEFYYSQSEDVSKGLEKDICLLSDLCGEKVKRYTTHMPLHNLDGLDFKAPAGIEDAGSEKYIIKDYIYLSDSNGVIRENWDNFLESDKNICLLIHPVWWLIKGDSWQEKIRKLALYKGKKLNILADKEIEEQENILKNRKQLDKKFKNKIRGKKDLE